MANNSQNLKMGFEIKKKGKVLQTEEFVTKMMKIQEEA